MSISQYILEKFSIEATPGRKNQCPSCSCGDFTIMASDTFGQCWHCGFKIYPSEAKQVDPLLKLSSAMMQLFVATMQARKGIKDSVYNYLHNNRMIPDTILKIAHIGEVPSFENFVELKSNLDEIVKIYKDLAEKAEKEEKEEAEKKLKMAEKLVELWPLLAEYEGATVFGYTDENNNLLKFKLRKHWSPEKKIIQIKFSASGGVFGIYSGIIPAKNHPMRPFLLEGEVDGLQFASFCNYAYGGLFVPVIASGSATNIDIHTIQKVCVRNPLVIRDADEAGEGMVSLLQRQMTVWVTSTPGTKDFAELIEKRIEKNISNFTVDFADLEYDNKWEKFIREIYLTVKDEFLTWEYNLFPREFEEIKKDILSLTEKKGSADRKYDLLINFFNSEILERASQPHGNNLIYSSKNDAYFLDMEIEKLYTVSENKEYKCFTSQMLSTESKTWDVTMSGLRDHINNIGRKIREHSVSYASLSEKFCLISIGNNKILKITPEKIEIDSAWQQDHIFQMEVSDPWTYIPPEKRCTSLDDVLLSDRLAPKNLSSKDLIFLLKCWMAFSFVRDDNTPHSIIVITGPKSSGKTVYGERIIKIINGVNSSCIASSGLKNPTDLLVVGTRNSVLLLDNVDKKKDWLEDVLATMATGGESQARKLYTDSDLSSIRPDAAIMLTSMGAAFMRDDIGARTILVNMDFNGNKIFQAEDREIIKKNRSSLMSEIADLIQTGLKNYSHNAYRPKSARMVEFANFCFAIDPQKNWDAIFDSVCQEQQDVVRAHDSIYEGILTAFQDHSFGLDKMSTSEICSAISESYENHNFRSWYFSGKPKLFGNKFRESVEDGLLISTDMTVSIDWDSHRKTNLYTILPTVKPHGSENENFNLDKLL